jgi:endonuclease/exonuclease/phosphatase family metal-dependent hydrolase
MKLEPICLGAVTQEHLPSEFTLSTWNVWFDRYRREERNAALLAELERYRPHVMLFQEVTPPFVRALQAAAWLKEGYWISGVEHTQIGVVMVARVQCHALGFHPLTSRMGRRLLVGRFAGGVAVAGAHFESNRDSGETRAAQFSEALDILEREPAAVLAGDFNSTAEEPESEKLVGRSRDGWSTLHPEKPGYTVDSQGNEMLHKQAPLKTLQIRIDRLLCMGKTEPLDIRLLGTEPFEGRDFPSDHFGLLATLAVKT